MRPKNNDKKKPLKEQDLAQITHFIRASGWPMPFLGLLGLVVGYVYWGAMGAMLGALTAIAVSLAVGLFIMLLTDTIGGTASGLLFGRRRAVWTVREQIQVTLNQARFSRENARYKEALDHINTVLSRDSEYPEALLLKAEILWDGYQALESAKRFLEKVLTLDFEDRIVYNRAESLYDRLVQTDMPEKQRQMPPGLEIGLLYNQGSIFKQITDKSRNCLKHALETKKAVDWAIIGIMVFASISLVTFLILNLNLERLDTSIEASVRTVEQVHQTAKGHAERVKQIDVSITKIESNIKYMQRKTKP